MTINQQDVEKELIATTSQLLQELGIPHSRDINLTASLQRQLGIDSLARAELFRRVEKSLQVPLPDNLLARAETLEDILNYLKTTAPQLKIGSRKATQSIHSEKSIVDPAKAQSLIDLLLMYGELSPNRPHIYFQNENGQEELLSYGQLLHESLCVAQGLRENGLEEGDTVAIMQPTQFGFFYTFFGTLLAGGVPVPIYPPFRMHMLEAYAKTEAHILNNAQVRFLVTFEEAEKLSYLLKAFVPSLKLVTTVEALKAQTPLASPFKASGSDFGFIQYTSGSTSDPKGVLLSHQNLLANIHGYGKSIRVTPDDVAVSWLPLYHDMGLIGMWLGSLYYGIPLVLMTPFSFLNHPERWLWAIHRYRGTLSGAPNFAYELCVRKLESPMLEGLDLSSWRMAANGAEKVYPRTLDDFANKFAVYGFKRSALLPVYGLAESTVALAIPPVDEEFKIDKVDRKKFEEERIAVPTQDIHGLEFVDCGSAMQDHEIRIVDDEDHVLPERHIGNLQFRGPSSMQGYYRNSKATAAVYHNGWIDSGDLAYLADGDVYITGRRKDLIIKAGRNLYPAEIEEIVGAVPGVRQGCVAAFSVTDDKRGTEQLVVVAETREKNKEQKEKIVASIRDAISTVLDLVPDDVTLVSPRIVPKTSSGKLQRAACKNMYLQGQLGKTQSAPWWQVTKLAGKWITQKAVSILRIMGKSIYTFYIALLLLISIPLVWLMVILSSPRQAEKICRIWAKSLLSAGFCFVEVEGKSNLIKHTPMVFAVNHASYVDFLVLLTILPIGTRFVGKKELFKTPVIRTFLAKLHYLAVDRVDLTKGLEDTKHIEQALAMGESIVIFPEGTFGYASGLRPFRLGAFKVAVEAGVPVCPIALQGTRQILRANEFLLQPHKLHVTVSDPVFPAGKEWQDVIDLRLAVRNVISQHCGEPSLDYIAAQTVAPNKPG